MPAPIERGVEQQSDGTWSRVDVKVAQRWRVRVVSDRAMVSTPQHDVKDATKKLRDMLADQLVAKGASDRQKEDAKRALEAAEKIIARTETLERTQRTIAQSHKFGHGEDFEIALDVHFQIWVRPCGSDTDFRKMAEMYGVSLQVVDNITNGIPHDIARTTKPGSDPEVRRWSCSCGYSSRSYVETEKAEQEIVEHLEVAATR